MNPNRVMLSEARSVEVKQLVECWTTGITGFTTLHTDDVRKIPDRILNMMPSRQDAERLANDVYVGMDVGILLDTRYNAALERNERYISQVAFFSREEGKNICRLVVKNGKMEDHLLELPKDILKRMKKAEIEDMFFNAELEEQIEEERMADEEVFTAL